MADAPLTGGFSPGARRFAVDGDFTSAWVCGPPEIYNPFPGDSVSYAFPIILLDRTLGSPAYVSVPLGTGFNVQDFAASQKAIVIEQEFMVADVGHVPLPLNTSYNEAWSCGWGNTYESLGSCFLVEEGPLVGIGGGISRFKRKFASLPPNRNEFSSYGITFPQINISGVIRFGDTEIRNTRVFHEYFVFDNIGLLPAIGVFPAGHRLTSAALAANGKYLCFEQFKGFRASGSAVTLNNFLGPDEPLDDGPPATTPSAATYQSWINTVPSEIVVEASSFDRWLGNIYVRTTRFGRPE